VSSEIMTIQELAAYLQVGPGKLYRLAQTGKIPATKVGRTWRFRRDLVNAWFAASSPGPNSKDVLDGAAKDDNARLTSGLPTSVVLDGLPPIGT
jgi:excisionase family DNA binding protein